MTVAPRDVEHIFERLRSGVVPERGLETFAVGIDRQRAEIQRQLALASQNEGTFKFLRGGYGCGKTFMSRLALLDAQKAGFATSFVVVSDNDLHFHRFDDVYRKVVQELGTNTCERGALSDVIDRWIARVEEGLVATGSNPEAEDFDLKVKARIEEDLASLTGGKAPEDMVRVLRKVFELKQSGQIVEASALLSWLSGSENVAGKVKRLAGIKGDIGSREALDYLHGILEIIKAAGYQGLTIVIDEVETVLRMRHDVRGKSLNGIRQICDAADRYRGLFWVFTGTPEFYDTNRGVAGLQPLNDRIKFLQSGGFANPRQPQLMLQPFDQERLKGVAQKLLEMYPAADRKGLKKKVTAKFIDRLIASVTAGFRGDVGVVPRQFLRQYVNILDLCDNFPEFDPMQAEDLAPLELNAEESRIQQGLPVFVPEPEDEESYTLVEF
jgi:hypothetical protein